MSQSQRTKWLMADYFRQLASWRRQRAEEYDRDARNVLSAAGLEELASYVLDLPDDDSRIDELGRLAVAGEQFAPGQQTHFAAARFRFYYEDTSCDAFLDRLIELQQADMAEMGHFGGTLPEGDDPWGGSAARSEPGGS